MRHISDFVRLTDREKRAMVSSFFAIKLDIIYLRDGYLPRENAHKAANWIDPHHGPCPSSDRGIGRTLVAS